MIVISKSIFLLFALMLHLLPMALVAQVEFISSNIPIVIIDTDSRKIEDETRIIANMGIIHNGMEIRNTVSDPHNNYSGKINIEYRGSTSLTYLKKSYGFETQEENDSVRNVSLIGMPEENDWILYGPYSDKTLIRNIISYSLSRELGNYAPRTRLCEFVLNGEYQGVYVLIEKIKKDMNRVDIATLRPDEISGDDLTGGYIIKIDKQTGNSGPFWYSEQGEIGFQYEYPKHDEIVEEQRKYIKSTIDKFEQALISDQFAHPQEGYRKYMDEQSLVDFFIINELSRNVDAYILSTFLYKDKDSNGGKLIMGPIWDFNFSFGNANYRNAYKKEGFQLNSNPSIWWWERFKQDSSFTLAVRNRWNNIREKQFSDEAIISVIDSLSLLLNEAQHRNFQRWNNLGIDIWPNYYIGETYQDEIDFLKTWILERLQWLDEELLTWNGLETLWTHVEPVVYPNPFTDYFQYDLSLTGPGDISLILYDLNGKQISALAQDVIYPAGEYTFEWHTSDIPDSVYILVLRINGAVVSIKKLVKL